jgi:predicted NACHT family NTPase
MSMARSLMVSQEGLKKATQAFETWGKTQEYLAGRVGCVRQTVGKFFDGRPVAKGIFQAICNELSLDWREIARLDGKKLDTDDSDCSDLEALVQQARERGQEDIEKRCGTMRVLDMSQPIGLGAIYTDVNILEKITGKTRRDLAELMQECTEENFDRFFLGEVREKRVDGLEVVQAKKQLMILGRPGAGKTTFLKRLATLCNQGEFLQRQVPVFVSLKEFAEANHKPRLLNYSLRLESAQDMPMEQVQHILKQGRGLVLLDGLDEVLEKDHDRVLKEIREFARHYHQSHIIITCRIAAREYIFEQFTEVEMADFSNNQIQDFADKWFKAKEPDQIDVEGKSTIAQLFWKALKEQEPIKELATNPLLLTLLCLEFEESSEFPQSRAELYERGLNILLSKWDGQRRIKRDEIYKRLSIKRKEIMLGHLAMHTFERGDYFFRADVAKKQIGQYIQNLPDASTDPDALLVDSCVVLKSIESQHGLLTERAIDIYSFSHLTFHEYFTAKNILDIFDPDVQKGALYRLTGHITEKRWREVFLLVVERMGNADYLLTVMLQKINSILSKDKALQRFLNWVSEKTTSLDAPYKPAAIRAFYLSSDRALTRTCTRIFDLRPNLDLARALDHALTYHLNILAFDLEPNLIRSHALNFTIDHALDLLTLDHALTLALDLILDLVDYDDDYDNTLDILNLNLDHALDLLNLGHTFDTFDDDFGYALDPKLESALQTLRDQLLPQSHDAEQFKQWWKTQGESWIEKLRAAMIEHRNIGHDWQLSHKQISKLNQYYIANLLLVDCMKRAYLSKEVRQRIEDGMLLPMG